MAIQLIIPNPTIPCTPGMCLVYVQDAFSIAPKYPTALASWEASAYRHMDSDFPQDAWVPLWFSVRDNAGGHVVIRQPDGSVWSASDPDATVPVHHASLRELVDYYSGRLTYLGWTEDVEDTLVLESATRQGVTSVSASSNDGQASAPLDPSKVSSLLIAEA